ncbi:MAG: TonB family protein [Acidobacteriota bacterium]
MMFLRDLVVPNAVPFEMQPRRRKSPVDFITLALVSWLILTGASQGQLAASGDTSGNRLTVPQLAAQLSEADVEIRLRAALTLRKLGPAAAPAAAELIKALRDEDPRVAEQALWTLAFIGSPGLAALPTLTAMVRDADEPNRVIAAAVLGLLKPSQPEPAAALIEATRSSDAELRRTAALALGALGAAALPGITPLARLATDQSDAVRQSAVIALGRLGGYAAPALPVLRALATGDDPNLRSLATSAVQRIESDLARPVQTKPMQPTAPPPVSPVDSPPADLAPANVSHTSSRTSAAPQIEPAMDGQLSRTDPSVAPSAASPRTVNRIDVVLLSQDKPRYTREAALRNVTGVVVVRVEFRADGRIGDVALVSGLGSGLDEEVLRAARSIKFLPARENGRAITTTMDIRYRFIQE